MKKNSLGQLKCPKCGTEVVIYKGWATFTEEKIDIMDGAKCRCPECGKTGKLDGDLLVD